MRKLSVAKFVTVAILVVTALLLGSFGILDYTLNRASRVRALAAEISVASDQLACGLALSVWDCDDAQIAKNLESAMKAPNLYGVEVSGKGIAQRLVRDEQWRVKVTNAPLAALDFIVEERPIAYKNHTIGMVKVFGTPRSIMKELKTRLVSTALFILLLEVILFLMLFLLLWQTVLRPLQKVERYAAAVSSGSGDYPVIDRAGFRGELERLRASIEIMVGLLQSRYEALRTEVNLRQESEERFRRAVVDSPFPIMLHAEGGAVIQVSQSWCEISGYTREELATIGDWTQRAYGKNKPRVMADINRLYGLNRREAQGDRAVHTKSGATRIWEFSAAPLGRLPDGRRLVISIAMDVTERRGAEEKLRLLNAELEERVRSRTAELEDAYKEMESFSYMVSHDLRAPLRSIDGWSQVFLEDCGAQIDAQGRDYLGRVRSEAVRMGQLIDALLQLARVTRVELHPVSVSLTGLVEAIGKRLQSDQPDRRIDLLVQSAVTAQGDPQLLEIVLINLMENAWKYTGKRARARIEFGCLEESDLPASAPSSVYFVRDNGAGFDMAHARKLFGAFQRMHTASDFPGTGIGLAIVERIIRRHGGRVWATSQVDQGTTIFFTLSTLL